ncbi:MAG TPA: HlyD family efflux transporter periplasmic adaptor subunit [Pirellulaceae bacterium]|nr:HlyD family efflux transporter periplasmic adaptor subunit [Pirellulaceae bacterium]
MRKLLGRIGLPIVAILLLGFGVFHMLSAQPHQAPTTPPALPPRSPLGPTIAAAGIVESQSENIAIGSAHSGVVLEVYVPADKAGIRVQAGDPLLRVDDRQLKAQLAWQQATLAAAEADLARLEAMPRTEELPAAEAKVRAAQSNLRLMRDQRERADQLKARGSIADQELVQRRLAQESAEAELARAQADLELLQAGAWEPDKQIARAKIAEAKAEIDQTQVEIERSLVRAPVDGEVLQVNVRPGEFVGTPPGQPLVLLGDFRQPHVRVDIDEHDIPRFRTGAKAKAFVRGDGEQELPLRFVRVEPYVIPKRSLTGDNTERVDTRVLQVIYAVDSADAPIFVGQQMDVFVDAAPAAVSLARSEGK